MAKRGRPKMNRPPEDVITSSGLTVGQLRWVAAGFKKRGYASAAHYLRHIVNEHIARVEAGAEDVLAPVVAIRRRTRKGEPR